MEWVFNATPRPLYPRGRDPVPIVQEAGWASGTVWTVAENIAPTRIRSSDHPARSESLYRLRYNRKWSRPNLLHYFYGICLDRLRNSTQQLRGLLVLWLKFEQCTFRMKVSQSFLFRKDAWSCPHPVVKEIIVDRKK